MLSCDLILLFCFVLFHWYLFCAFPSANSIGGSAHFTNHLHLCKYVYISNRWSCCVTWSCYVTWSCCVTWSCHVTWFSHLTLILVSDLNLSHDQVLMSYKVSYTFGSTAFISMGVCVSSCSCRIHIGDMCIGDQRALIWTCHPHNVYHLWFMLTFTVASFYVTLL